MAAENIITTVKGNSKNDFKTDIDECVQNNGVKLTVLSTSREYNEIRVRYKMEFDESDISSIKDLGTDLYFKRDSVFFTDVFEDCDIWLNDIKLNCRHDDNLGVKPIYNDKGFITNETKYCKDYLKRNNESNSIKDKLLEKGIFLWQINDINIGTNEIEQELVVTVKNKDCTNDFNFKMEFNKIKIGDKVIEGPWIASHNMKNNQYDNELEKTPLDINYQTSNGASLNVNGYAISNTGIKLYANETSSDEVRDAELEKFIKNAPDTADENHPYSKQDLRNLYHGE